MGDAGEGLVDAEARIFERMEELERQRAEKRVKSAGDAASLREVEGLKLARTELKRQLGAVGHERRRTTISDALVEVDRQIAVAIAAIV